MYTYASREEWLFRGLAIAMILALVGMAVMSTVVELKYGFAASEFGLAWGIAHGDVASIITSGIGLAAAIASMYFMPATAPLWYVVLTY